MNNKNTFIVKFLWCFLGFISLSAVVLINNYSPYIPDYDGLSYFEYVKIINGWLFNKDASMWLHTGYSKVTFIWPLTNAISVMIAAIFFKIIDINLLPTFINSLYLLIFVSYVANLRSYSYALASALLLCSQTFFYRIFTTLTSEFSVGLWIFAFLLTLTSSSQRRYLYLSVLILVGLFLRTIDIIFVLFGTSAYVIFHYVAWKDKDHITKTISYVGLTLVLTIPLFFLHYLAAIEYIHESHFGLGAAAWKSLAGVSTRFDVALKYGEILSIYNKVTLISTALVVTLALYFKTIDKKSILIIIGTSFALCFPLLVGSTLNIQVVFWVFATIIFVCCEVGLSFAKFSLIPFKFIVCLLFFYCLFFLHKSWFREVQYLVQQKELSKIAFDISDVLEKSNMQSYIATNFWGVGQLDYKGLSWRRSENLIYSGFADMFSKNIKVGDYLHFDQKTNFFISAHDNYFFPPHFGINDHVKEINTLFTPKSGELGFRKVAEISQNNTNFDIWYRPSAQAHLQFLNFDDKWIATNLPLDIGNKELCAGKMVNGRLNLSVTFPNVNIANYSPPFTISLLDASSENLISSVIVNNYGKADVIFDFKNVGCGKYSLFFDKTFSTKEDSRMLSAQFIKLDSALKFDLSEKGNE